MEGRLRTSSANKDDQSGNLQLEQEEGPVSCEDKTRERASGGIWMN
jgi:hypothetical protein